MLMNLTAGLLFVIVAGVVLGMFWYERQCAKDDEK